MPRTLQRIVRGKETTQEEAQKGGLEMMTKERIVELESRAYRQAMAIGNAWNDLDECLSEIESLQSRVAELEKDKARLDWLQKTGCTLMAIADFTGDEFDGFHWEMAMSRRLELSQKDVRCIIDAAMKGTNEH